MPTVFEYTQNNVLVIPQALFAMDDVTVIASHQNSAIFYKHLALDLKDIDFYTNTPCFIYIESGQEILTDIDNNTIILTAGSAIFLSKGLMLNSNFVKKAASLKAYLVFFDKEVVSAYLSSNLRRNQRLKTNSNVIASFYKKENVEEFLDFFTSFQVNLKEPNYLATKLLELLHLIVWRFEDMYVLSILLKQCRSEKVSLTELLNKQDVVYLTVTDLAKISGQSISSLNREFKSQFNVTPKQWLLAKKLSHAKLLLERKDVSVTEVAFSVGYENVSSFIKAFKNKYGVTPKQIK